MEEHVGALWHRVITRIADRRYPQAAVDLGDVAQTAGILFRALGGDGGLEVCAAETTVHGARRGLLQRVAGIGERIELAWRDDRTLRLPPVIDCFPRSASTAISTCGSPPWRSPGPLLQWTGSAPPNG